VTDGMCVPETEPSAPPPVWAPGSTLGQAGTGSKR
jgi:hypothetical protein